MCRFHTNSRLYLAMSDVFQQKEKWHITLAPEVKLFSDIDQLYDSSAQSFTPYGMRAI